METTITGLYRAFGDLGFRVYGLGVLKLRCMV